MPDTALAASYEHQAGMWLSATQTFRLGLLAQHTYADAPMDLERYSYVRNMLIDQTYILRAARTVRPQYLPFIDAATTATGLARLLDELLSGAQQGSALVEEDYAEIVDRDGLGRPFSDAGPTRRYGWSALGTTWSVECANDQVAVLTTERFVAALQITQAELASQDALLLCGAVAIEVRPDRPTRPTEAEYCEILPSNDGSRWLLHLTPAAALDEETARLEITSAVMCALLDRSLLSREDFMGLIDRAFMKGLWHKLLASRPYDEIADLLEYEHYEEMAALTAPAPGAGVSLAIRPRSNALAPLRTPAQGYDRSESLEAVTARYENMIPMVRFTLARLVADADFQATVQTLRGEGWLDWHLLTAVANLTGNERARRRGLRSTAGMAQAEHDHFRAVMYQAESEADERLPTNLFTEDQLRFHLNVAVLSTLANLELSLNQRTPDFPAIFQFLGDRYAYWTNDVPHEAIFDPPTSAR